MTWIAVIVSFFILIILAEELVYHFLRTRIMENQPERKRNAGKIKEWLYKMKLKPHNGQQQNH
ncbi:hypothetical protein FHE72_12880 [Rossellomorea vietnamensis]|uniref:Uncharacterized protein n=1 Tax=Rossellomorea vietnamensis TaxID=218284 RepID=A0A6I6UKG0_9BACI|nr:hypothetical protein [Rossellomorea vietnamensis]QHE61807.1 hypothetical protein FHE72_12880 [Rossellomorea vietnamensis]